jgi:hypothetical protein
MSLTPIQLVAVVAVLALLLLFLAGLVFRGPAALRRAIESIFRRPERPARTAGDEQYYRPYWSR